MDITIRLTFSREEVDNILITAFEDPHSSFTLVNNSHVCANGKGPDPNIWYLPTEGDDWCFDLIDNEEEHRYKLNAHALKRGIEKYINWMLETGRDIVLPGSTDFDAIQADIVLQFALIGELVYG